MEKLGLDRFPWVSEEIGGVRVWAKPSAVRWRRRRVPPLCYNPDLCCLLFSIFADDDDTDDGYEQGRVLGGVLVAGGKGRKKIVNGVGSLLLLHAKSTQEKTQIGSGIRNEVTYIVRFY